MADDPGDGPDDWLPRWLPLLKASAADAAGAPVLELGCGPGRDTAMLVGAGLSVVALELSTARLDEARQRVPAGASFHTQDIRAPFPLDASSGRAGAVLASLSLHYFDWPEKLRLVARIRQTLQPGGLLVCRLNSVHDLHHGAQAGTPIDAADPLFVHVDGWDKRFFDRPQVEALFARGWHWHHLEERTVMRYRLPKVLWEAVLTRDGD
ncbi:MAG: class I SAM-dependent methyltransferase [Proteobacteria bacterium]|nr:class I SAM-dependent methyltransferase [Pseudomonadota bacterium]